MVCTDKIRSCFTAAIVTFVFIIPNSINAAQPQQPAIASAHPLATQAGYLIFERGGNAFDAAIAVSAVLSVVEPYSSGLGGGAFFLIHREQDKYQTFIDAREKAPNAATAEMYQDTQGMVIPRASLVGPLASGIPGLPAGLVHLSNKYGALPLEQSLAAAIELAEKGFPVYERLNTALKVAQQSRGSFSQKFIEVFTSNNELPEVGQLIKQPELANTLRLIASQGHKGFYDSEFTKIMVKEARKDGSIWHVDDFKNYSVIEREPIDLNFMGHKLTLAPPPSSGGTTIATILNIVSNYDYKNMPRDTFTHLLIEAMRRAYKDRSEHLGDPDFIDVPVEMLVSKNHAFNHSATIDLDKASSSMNNSDIQQGPYIAKGTETTHFSILDEEGNRVAATQTINTWFGSGYMLPTAGIVLNNEMDDFSAKLYAPNRYGLVHGQANSIAPNKRMLSSMSPTFIESKDQLAILGTPGGARIITMVLLSLISLTEGADANEMTSNKRFHHQYLPDEVRYENGAFDNGVIESLKSKGHHLKEISDYGNMQVVTMKYSDGSVVASSDPRALIENIEILWY
ncbi:uncharacterized protein METZ01_LOCUS141328 [marine metagenome]|uniref:Gamma-glutamyltransferase n=1 Tax=marine metagenome TaxID=408172 RepID=A0A381ZH71_9ZZZZ